VLVHFPINNGWENAATDKKSFFLLKKQAVIAQQHSPILLTLSTTHVQKLSGKKQAFARRVKQFKLLHARLAAFYGRHGPSKVDKVVDILDLYAGKEEALLAGLGDKYGEKVPGDATLLLPLCISTAEEVLQFLPRSPSKAVCFIDVRSDDEISAMGVVHGFLQSKDLQELFRQLAALDGKPRIFLVASGKVGFSFHLFFVEFKGV